VRNRNRRLDAHLQQQLAEVQQGGISKRRVMKELLREYREGLLTAVDAVYRSALSIWVEPRAVYCAFTFGFTDVLNLRLNCRRLKITKLR